MFDDNQIEKLREGVYEWNEWRKRHPFVKINLSDAKYTGVDLRNIDLRSADLSRVDLSGTDLSGADLTGADIRDANLSGTNLTEANVRGVIYDRKAMVGKYIGIRVDQCIGDAVFKRDAQDQDYIDTLQDRCSNDSKYSYDPLNGRSRFKAICRMLMGNIGRFMFFIWKNATDYGRSIPRIGFIAFVIICTFGRIYQSYPGLVDYGMPYSAVNVDPCVSANPTWFSPYYYSVVTFTTLGFGDISANGVGGQIAVVCEVMAGYVTLGLLISILANKIARRS